jgi:putative tryptophan/tyrosine transport system substrate-binding protein
MKRREFIGGLGAAAGWPVLTHAQQSAMPVVGFLRDTSFAPFTHLLNAFRMGLKEAGFVEGQSVAIEYRSAEGRHDRLPALASDLIRRPVDVIVGNVASVRAAKALTTTVPIVFVVGSDPINEGLVANHNRPGGNVTGAHFFGAVLGAKRLELLRQVVPKVVTMGMLVNPYSPNTEAERIDVQAAAQAIGQQILFLNITSSGDIETAFATLAQRGVGALLVGSGAFMNSNRERFVTLAARHKLPASYTWREAVVAGGLMSYGASQSDAYRQAGIYTGRILKGEKPGELPVVQSTKLEFVFNLKAAKMLGLEVPDKVLALADEVIE